MFSPVWGNFHLNLILKKTLCHSRLKHLNHLFVFVLQQISLIFDANGSIVESNIPGSESSLCDLNNIREKKEQKVLACWIAYI